MSTADVVAAIQESAAGLTPTRISGRSTWLTAGRPVKAPRSVSLRDDTGVVSYVPGDLTLTVRAGTTLAEIERITAEHDQWLPLDPYGSNEGTIGATIATASAGPLATGFGLPRDLVLGLEFVNGRGDIVRAGGKVVKNVAGFDLSRLLTGSWGTLGVITELTLRLYARPKADRTFVIDIHRLGGKLVDFLRAFSGSPFSAYALELLSASAASALGFGSAAVCLLRLGGNTATVDAQLVALRRVADPKEIETSTWLRVRTLENGSLSVIRVSGLPARFAAAAQEILSDRQSHVFTYVSPVRGSMRIIAQPVADAATGAEAEVIVSMESETDTAFAFETLPADVWPHVSPSVVSDSLSRGIRKAYDPHNILNPGILGD